KGDWKQRKLGQAFSERKEKSSSGNLLSVTIANGVVRAESLDRKDNSSKDKSNYRCVRIGDIAYNSMRMWQGASGVSLFNGIVSPAYTVLVPKENINPVFFAAIFKHPTMIQIFRANSQGLTSDTWNLKYRELKHIMVNVPTIHEQITISHLLQILDHIIALHQNKMTALKSIKTSLLQKLFV
ncbi:MAG: restriction endonuclease subunit S, partial [Liquorilactobacillus satsumensis]|uniref:restriction endonuclease subunit S n=1 Tax=Liquorilactobacillus satsumensis TaxID=259059 RepID=UPI0039EBFBBB